MNLKQLVIPIMLSACSFDNNKTVNSQTNDVITGTRRTSLWPFSDSNLVRSVIWSTNWTVQQTKAEKRQLQCWYIRDFDKLTVPDFKNEKSLFCNKETRKLTSTAVDADDTFKYFTQQKSTRMLVNWLTIGGATAATVTACAGSTLAAPESGGSSLMLAKGICSLIPTMIAGFGIFSEWDPSWGVRPIADYVRLDQFVANNPQAFYSLNDNAMGFFVKHVPQVPTTGITCGEAISLSQCRE